MRDLQRETGTSILFITHDLGVVAEVADRVLDTYAGRVVEAADVVDLFEQLRMSYTSGPLRSTTYCPRQCAEPAGLASRLRLQASLRPPPTTLHRGVAAARGDW